MPKFMNVREFLQTFVCVLIAEGMIVLLSLITNIIFG